MIKPILFNTQMVQAILEDRKTTTRRIIKVNNSFDFIGCSSEDGCGFNRAAFGKGSFDKLLDAEIKERAKAPYMPGDILYVRETWLKADDGKYYFRANETPVSREARGDFGYKWHPSLHMPKEAARIFLEVTSVKVQRLQSITHKDVIYEGTPYDEEMFKFNICLGQDKAEFFLKSNFKDLWDSTVNKKEIDKYGWNANPWVWVIEFERIEKSEIDQ